jgi:hypothetical protein
VSLDQPPALHGNRPKGRSLARCRPAR